jgi:short-subunit dehydrogenase
MRFEPRHVLVTGAAGAIGGALCRILAQRNPGLRFSLVDRAAEGLSRLSAELTESGGRAAALSWDLADPSTMPALWQRARQTLGAIDLLINCAGVMEIRSFSATPWELGERLINIDLISPLRLMHLAVADMPAGSRIVNISSMAGRVPMRGYSFYGAAKAGLGIASEIAALDLAGKGISVLTVYPGPVRTPLEARGRTQLHADLISRHAPVGDPQKLAQRIERALRKNQQRLVYPAIYSVAEELLSVTNRFAGRLSPIPTDEP